MFGIFYNGSNLYVWLIRNVNYEFVWLKLLKLLKKLNVKWFCKLY